MVHHKCVTWRTFTTSCTQKHAWRERDGQDGNQPGALGTENARAAPLIFLARRKEKKNKQISITEVTSPADNNICSSVSQCYWKKTILLRSLNMILGKKQGKKPPLRQSIPLFIKPLNRHFPSLQDAREAVKIKKKTEAGSQSVLRDSLRKGG